MTRFRSQRRTQILQRLPVNAAYTGGDFPVYPVIDRRQREPPPGLPVVLAALGEMAKPPGVILPS